MAEWVWAFTSAQINMSMKEFKKKKKFVKHMNEIVQRQKKRTRTRTKRKRGVKDAVSCCSSLSLSAAFSLFSPVSSVDFYQFLSTDSLSHSQTLAYDSFAAQFDFLFSYCLIRVSLKLGFPFELMILLNIPTSLCVWFGLKLKKT